jgi:hypothetical protein
MTMIKLISSSALVLVILSGCGAGTTVIFPSTSATGQPQASTPSGGTWTGAVSYEWTRHNVVSGTDTKETTDEKYAAHTQVTSEAVDIDRWKLTGQGTVESSRSIVSDFTIGNCSHHYTDEASGSKSVVVPDGGIEIDDDRYQIRVEIPGITGSETSSRNCPAEPDDTHDWEVADHTVLESGTLADPNTISGSETGDNGELTTWELHRTP